MHTESSGSFATPEFGPLGVVDAGAVIFKRRRLPRPAWRDPSAEPGLRVQRIEPAVELLQTYTGMSDRLVRAVAQQRRARPRPRRLRSRQRAAADRAGRSADAVRAGMLVTVSSRCVAGRVRPRYGYEGGGLRLTQVGAILAGDLSGAKARLLQMVALGLTGETRAAGEIIRTMI